MHCAFFCPCSLVISLFNDATLCVLQFSYYRGADKSLARPGRKQARKHVRDARSFNNIETRAVIKFLFLRGKAPKEIRAILTETLTSFLSGQSKDLSAPLYRTVAFLSSFIKVSLTLFVLHSLRYLRFSAMLLRVILYLIFAPSFSVRLAIFI